MATEYKLSYTAQEIDEKLKNGASIKMTTTDEYEKLDKIDENTLYMFTDVDEVEVVPPDFAQNDLSAPDYIKNRTHWAEAPVTTTTVIMSETAYEGFADGYLELLLDAPLFDFKPDTEYTVTWDGVEYTVMTEKYLNFTICGNPAILGIEENAEDNGQPFSFAYNDIQLIEIFMSNDLEAVSHTVGITRTVTTQEIHKLDDKYINAEWLPQKTMIPTVGIVETTMTVKASGEDRLPSESYDMSALESAEYYDVLWNGETYRCVPKVVSGILFIGNLAIAGTSIDSGEPFVFMCSELYGGVVSVVSAETEATFSITCYNSAIVSTIPEEYLPEKLQFGNEYEAEIQKEAITWDGDTTGRVTLESISSDLGNAYHVSRAVPTFEDLSNGGYIVLREKGITQSMEFASQEVYNMEGALFLVFEGLICVVTETVTAMFGVPAGIYFRKIDDDNYVKGFSINNYTFTDRETKIKTIDPKYLPEGFGASKYFEKETMTTDFGNTLTWDGNTTDLVQAKVIFDGQEAAILYKISNIILTQDDVVNGISYQDGTAIKEISGEDAQSMFLDSGLAVFDDLCIVPTNNYVLNLENGVRIIFPEVGIYMPQAGFLTVNGYNFIETRTTEYIKAEYLPKDIGSGSGLPEVSAEDEGSFLRVINGEWKAVVMSSVEEGEF